MDPLVINEESVILDILNDIPYTDLHSHMIPKHVLNNFRSIKRLKPEITSSSRYKFTLPEEGFLERLVLKITFTSFENVLTDGLGARVFEKITLKQGLKDVFSNDMNYIISRINSEPVNKQKNYNELINPQLNLCLADNVVYCPIFSSFFDVSNNNIFLNYIRRLDLHCDLNIPVAQLLLYLDVELLCYVKNYTKEYYNTFIKNEFIDDQKNYFSYDTYTITTNIIEGSSRTLINLNGPYLCFAIHNIIFNSNYTMKNIDKMVLNCNGLDVISIKPQENSFIDPSYYQYNGSLLSYYFGSKDRTYHSGSININTGPWTLTIYHDQITTSGYTLHTTLEYFCIMECDRLGILSKNILF